MLDDLRLTGVTIIGNSVGGWIAAGLEIADHPIADFFPLTMDRPQLLPSGRLPPGPGPPARSPEGDDGRQPDRAAGLRRCAGLRRSPQVQRGGLETEDAENLGREPVRHWTERAGAEVRHRVS
jgi:hypothetical protein